MSLRPRKTISQRQGNTLLTGPSTEPLLLEEVKDYMRLPSEQKEDDNLITDLITRCRRLAEEKSGVVLLNQTFRLTLDNWPGYREPWWDGVVETTISELYGPHDQRLIRLPRFPLQSVDTMTVFDTAGASSTVTIADVFIVDTNSIPGVLTLQFGATWPIATQPITAIRIDYTAGFGTTRQSIPETLRGGLLDLIDYVYNHRGGCSMADAYVKSGAHSVFRSYSGARL